MGHGDAGLGEVLEGRRNLGCHSLPLRLHRSKASRQGGDDSPMRGRLWIGVVSAMLGLTPLTLVRAQSPDVGTDARGEAGKALYLKNCAQCHGDKGDGEGYATPHLYPKPRNFTTGKFKVRTTPNGSLPTHQDLVNIIRRGMPYTSMPAWPNFSDADVANLAYFVTTFSPEFSKAENIAKPVDLPSA